MSNISTGSSHWSQTDPLVKIARTIMESTVGPSTTVGQPADTINNAADKRVVGKPNDAENEVVLNPVIPTYQPNHTTTDGDGNDEGAGMTKPQA